MSSALHTCLVACLGLATFGVESAAQSGALRARPPAQTESYRLFALSHDMQGASVNSRGVAVARSVSGQDSFTWSPATGLQHLTPLAGLPWAVATEVNRAGFVVGTSYDNVQSLPTLWSPTGAPLPISGSPGGNAIAINDAGVVVGRGFVGTVQTPWVWDPVNGMRPLSSFGLPDGNVPSDLSNSGFVVGGSPGGQAFRLDLSTSTLTPLGALGLYSGAFGVNNQGHAVGWSTTGANDTVPFLWTPESGMQRLGPLMPPFLFLDTGWAWSINDSEVVVGEIEVSTDFYHAFLWDEVNGMRDLNDLVVNPGPYELLRAKHISRSGWIAGEARDHSAGNTLIGFVLAPLQ